jgi:glycosyltransferase involved in cell wall biosynthesis
MSTPKISVIVPVWNVEKYLRRSLDSICGQTLKELELITINDCSPDNSLAILQEYAAKDNRIKVINFPENRGVSAARNAGIDAAEGEYLGFVDPDDAIEPKFYETLYNKAKERGADIVNGNRKQFDFEGNEIISQNYHVRFWEAQIIGVFWTAIYRTSLIRYNNIRFPEDMTIGEDLVFLYHAMFKANKVLASDFVYYYYYRRPDSAYTANFSPSQVDASIKLITVIAAEFTQAYADCVIPSHIYDLFIYKSLVKATMIATRTDDTHLKYKSAQAAFHIYEQCLRKEFLLDRLYEDNYNTYLCLKANNEKLLTRFLVENETIKDIAASDDALPAVYLER